MTPLRKRALAWVLGTVAAAAVVAQAYIHFVPWSISWNLTPSIPTGLYGSRTYAGEQLNRGDLVCFRYREPVWATGRAYFPAGYRLCKPVAGLPGDVVRKSAGRVQVLSAGTVVVDLPVASQDRKGRALQTDLLEEGVVPAGKLVLLAPRFPNSLDSRYLGLVPHSELTHQVWPLWVKE